MRKNLFRNVFVIAAVAVALVTFWWAAMPDFSKLLTENPKTTAFMKHQEETGYKRGRKVKAVQIWTPLSNISPYLIRAVLIAEDDKFWSHEGFDYEAIKRALEKDIKAGKFKLGGSTISQQLARNLYLSPQKSLLRKVREAIITWRLEQVLSKRRILELYLNLAEWGEGIFGIEAAARHYYGKPSSHLTARESARLAAILPNPKKYDPTGNQSYVLHRSDLIFDIMVRRGIVLPDYPDTGEESELGVPADSEEDPSPAGEALVP